jgi:hypothetical protein
MAYVRGQEVEKWSRGSLEDQAEMVAEAISATVGAPVVMLATRSDGALFQSLDGKLQEAAFTRGDDGAVAGVTIRDSSIRVHGEEDLPVLVAEELRDITAAMLRGEVPQRTRVRALARSVVAGEQYTLGGVLQRVDEAMAVTGEQHWHTAYEANVERIRTSLWGQIRELEARVPKTAYAQLPRTRLAEFAPELRESMTFLANAFTGVIDEIAPLVFDQDREYEGAIRESLIAEAQLLRGLLAKAGQLMRAEDLDRAAVAHDRLCGRARLMEVAAAYIVRRAQKGAEEKK